MIVRTLGFRGWLRLGFAALVLTAGCQRQSPPATDSKSRQKHIEELKQQLERELKNK
jgi:hypothetical protein